MPFVKSKRQCEILKNVHNKVTNVKELAKILNLRLSDVQKTLKILEENGAIIRNGVELSIPPHNIPPSPIQSISFNDLWHPDFYDKVVIFRLNGNRYVAHIDYAIVGFSIARIFGKPIKNAMPTSMSPFSPYYLHCTVDIATMHTYTALYVLDYNTYKFAMKYFNAHNYPETILGNLLNTYLTFKEKRSESNLKPF